MYTLTPVILQAAYDFLSETPPFNKWNLPDGDDLCFKVTRSAGVRGWYSLINGQHTIAVSGVANGHTDSIMQVVGHEMCHLHQYIHDLPGGAHGPAWRLLYDEACAFHGWDSRIV
jgi:hypothetical protein